MHLRIIFFKHQFVEISYVHWVFILTRTQSSLCTDVLKNFKQIHLVARARVEIKPLDQTVIKLFDNWIKLFDNKFEDVFV